MTAKIRIRIEASDESELDARVTVFEAEVVVRPEVVDLVDVKRLQGRLLAEEG